MGKKEAAHFKDGERDPGPRRCLSSEKESEKKSVECSLLFTTINSVEYLQLCLHVDWNQPPALESIGIEAHG